MKKIKHSKFKNTGFIFELLVRQVTSEILASNKSVAETILKEFFNSKKELEEDGVVGRPKDATRYGKDDHPQGRDPLGIKTLKQKEGSVKYKPRNSYFEIFKDMDGNKKKILTENTDKIQ